MQKITGGNILDLVPTDNGFIYLSKEADENGNNAGAAFRYTEADEMIESIELPEYLEIKFGENFRKIAVAVKDFVNCKFTSIFNDMGVASLNDGTLIMFNSSGETIKKINVGYLDFPAVSPSVNGNELWFAVPEGNAVINYNIKYRRIDFRIGGPNVTSFCHPVDVSVYDHTLFICNLNSYKIKVLSLDSFNVNDYMNFTEPVLRYFRSSANEYVMLKSGIYTL